MNYNTILISVKTFEGNTLIFLKGLPEIFLKSGFPIEMDEENSFYYSFVLRTYKLNLLKKRMKYPIVILLLSSIWLSGLAQNTGRKVKIGVAGMTHGHIHGILGHMSNENYTVVGIAESNKELAERLFRQYNISDSLWFKNLDEMINETHPDGVMAFNSIFEHKEVVEICAPRHIHVMVEKPLAVSNEHADAMAAIARKNNILLLTNYETTWYATTEKIFQAVRQDNQVGDLRKVVIRDGHEGPMEIGVSKEFLEWLTDPVMNGGGALFDFGCYGANLITGLMKNEIPLTVTAVTQQIKPDIYPDVDDEATIILTYPKTQGIIEASWNWPYNRKDMDIYGTKGAIFQLNGSAMQFWGEEENEEMTLPPRKYPENNPFTFFAAVIQGNIVLKPSDLSSLENNLIVIKILDAARKSAQTGETVRLE